MPGLWVGAEFFIWFLIIFYMAFAILNFKINIFLFISKFKGFCRISRNKGILFGTGI